MTGQVNVGDSFRDRDWRAHPGAEGARTLVVEALVEKRDPWGKGYAAARVRCVEKNTTSTIRLSRLLSRAYARIEAS